MSKKTLVRFAPSRNGRAVASSWRVWHQGDEFYAAPRSGAQIGKVSFHRAFNWQFRAGSLMRQLARPLALSNGWFHALRLTFLVESDAFSPVDLPGTTLVLIDTPLGKKLTVDIAVQERATTVVLEPPAELRLDDVRHGRLRDGRWLIVGWSLADFTPRDRWIVEDARSTLNINFAQQPDMSEISAEAVWHQFRPSGNHITIIPVGPEVVRVEVQDAT